MAENQLRPGMLVRPGPVATMVKLVHVEGAAKIVLHFEHSTGATTLPFNPADAENFAENVLALARQAQGKPTGKIEVATADQLPRGGVG